MSSRKEMARRLRAIRLGLKKAKLDGFLILDRANTLYATGLSCTSSYVLLALGEAHFLTDFRYIEVARKEIEGFDVRLHGPKPAEDLARLVKRLNIKRLGVERNLPFGLATEFAEAFAADLIPDDTPIASARARKSPAEIALLREAVHRADAAYADLARDVEAGWTEIEVRNRLRRLIERHGGEKESFDSIVATGTHASSPHAHPTSRLLKPGEIVQIDTGLIYTHYCSDLSRVLSVGRPTQKMRAIHRIVCDAQRRAIEAIRPGVRCAGVDARARDYIAKKGYGKNFGHGLGHGVGLEIHEAPTLRANSADVLEEGMVVTVEPGIYLPGWGGIRIEDMVVVTKDGCENLTTAQRRIALI